MFSRLRVEDAMHKGQSIYPTEDQTYPGADGDDGDDDDEETESSDEEAFVRLENGN